MAQLKRGLIKNNSSEKTVGTNIKKLKKFESIFNNIMDSRRASQL